MNEDLVGAAGKAPLKVYISRLEPRKAAPANVNLYDGVEAMAPRLDMPMVPAVAQQGAQILPPLPVAVANVEAVEDFANVAHQRRRIRLQQRRQPDQVRIRQLIGERRRLRQQPPNPTATTPHEEGSA